MYHEEKVINGVLMYRTTPTGKWHQASATAMTQRITELQDRTYQLENILRENGMGDLL